MPSYSQQQGFTLIELLVTITIVGILATIAIPSYLNHVTKGRRIDGKSALLNMSSAMERRYGHHHTYADATVANLGLTSLTPNGFYTLSIASATETTYDLRATPTLPQATNDTDCGTLTLNHLGQKGISGTAPVASCWQT